MNEWTQNNENLNIFVSSPKFRIPTSISECVVIECDACNHSNPFSQSNVQCTIEFYTLKEEIDYKNGLKLFTVIFWAIFCTRHALDTLELSSNLFFCSSFRKAKTGVLGIWANIECQRINITRSHLAVWHCFTCVLPIFRFASFSILRLMGPWNIIIKTIADAFDCQTNTIYFVHLQFDLLAKVRVYIFQYFPISLLHILSVSLSLSALGP